MNKTVLIIDDEDINRELYKEFLKYGGYTVLEAENGLEGLHLAYDDAPDFIILDYLLPDINGDVLYEKLKANPKTVDIPVILISAHFDKSELADQCPDIPLEDIYLKPINHREIKKRIDYQLVNGCYS